MNKKTKTWAHIRKTFIKIVFSTKNREQILTKPNRQELFKYIGGNLKNKHCHLYRINGVDDHLHIVRHLHPSVALATLIKDIKPANSDYIKNGGIFQKFSGLQDGYDAFTYSIKEKERLIEYVKNQEEHHKIKTFREEYVELLNEQKIEFDERYLL